MGTIASPGSPPLVRGVLPKEKQGEIAIRITPACAGSTFSTNLKFSLSKDRPRLRGEYFFNVKDCIFFTGSPPLTRGVLCLCCSGLCRHRITPACAGSTKTERRTNNMDKDHPRLRGEYIPCFQQRLNQPGSPPLARGVQDTLYTARYGYRITPACAGSTITIICLHFVHKDHPRLRGEYLASALSSSTLIGSPPLARGVHHNSQNVVNRLRITPACAGSTCIYCLC